MTDPTPVDQMDFLRQKINSHQGPVGDFADALEGSAPQESDELIIDYIDYWYLEPCLFGQQSA